MKININLLNANYDITIDNLPNLEFDTKVLIVTNPKVAGFHLKYLLPKLSAKEIYIVTLPDGENYKTMQNLEFLIERCFDYRLDRKSILIAFGGGVIGDMSGFASSIYQRGIDFIQIPTTLLSQVDASVGGKTGVNNKYGKNLIGTFHQPRAVYIDTYFLRTLPLREFMAGVSEIIKMAVMFDMKFFEWLESADLSNDENLKIAIKKSIELKAEVVSLDEKESSIRASLNYGHTFAHIIENFTNYSTYLHGEAVAIGMIMANELAYLLGLLSESEKSRIFNLIQKYNLPTTFKIENVNKFYEAFYLDKKSFNSKIKFILPESIGGFVMRDDIEESKIKEMLGKFC